jgi:hypothetical protein
MTNVNFDLEATLGLVLKGGDLMPAHMYPKLRNRPSLASARPSVAQAAC